MKPRTDDTLACPVCGSPLSKVTDTGDPTKRNRAYKAWDGWTGKGKWRERICTQCQTRFATEEIVTGWAQPST